MGAKVPVDHATPKIDEPMQTPEEMVAAASDTIAKIQASPNIAQATEVQAALAPWAAATAALDTNNKAKKKARDDLHQAETNEPPLIRRWKARRHIVLGALAAYGDGSKALIQSFNVGVQERAPAPLAVTPENLRAMKKQKPTYASVRWDKVPGAHGYMLQHATNNADASTYSAPISLSETRFHLTGQAPGTTVWFRVLACDSALPNGQTTWSAWVPVVVTG